MIARRLETNSTADLQRRNETRPSQIASAIFELEEYTQQLLGRLNQSQQAHDVHAHRMSGLHGLPHDEIIQREIHHEQLHSNLHRTRSLKLTDDLRRVELQISYLRALASAEEKGTDREVIQIARQLVELESACDTAIEYAKARAELAKFKADALSD